MLGALTLLATTLACGGRTLFPGSSGPVLPRRGGPLGPATSAVTGDVQHQVQGGHDGQADRGPADHIQRVVCPRYTRATAFRVASTNATTAQRRGSTRASSPAMAKVMMAPGDKAQPGRCTPCRTASADRGPGRSRWTSSLTSRSGRA